jgi:hypothetical protein
MTLRWVPGWNGLTEPEAVSYVAAVEAADGEPLEFGVAKAINDFILGCKNDGIWDAIKASCILAGARTLNGALVPLAGTAPTNFNFVAGDYNRETGLVGDGSTKYLNSNRSGNADPQNSFHLCVHVSVAQSNSSVYVGAEGSVLRNTLYANGASLAMSLRESGVNFSGVSLSATGLIGASRSASNLLAWQAGGSGGTFNTSSSSETYGNVFVFARNDNGPQTYTNARLAFYSIGESLDLALLDTRVSDLITAIGAAIP